MNYLYDKQYYFDLYDLSTIKDCLKTIDMFKEMYRDSLKDKKIKDIPEDEKLKSINYILNEKLFITTGERYRNRKKRIEEMMELEKFTKSLDDFNTLWDSAEFEERKHVLRMIIREIRAGNGNIEIDFRF